MNMSDTLAHSLADQRPDQTAGPRDLKCRWYTSMLWYRGEIREDFWKSIS